VPIWAGTAFSLRCSEGVCLAEAAISGGLLVWLWLGSVIIEPQLSLGGDHDTSHGTSGAASR